MLASLQKRALIMELTKDEAYAVADLISVDLIDRIRNDIDIDSMEWLINIVHAYEKLCKFSGYVGLTDNCGKVDSSN